MKVRPYHVASVLAVLPVTAISLAQPGPDGFDWVTVGAPNNPAYNGPDPENLVTGRGSVGYEYRMGRTEITTAQWMEYINTFTARANPISISDLALSRAASRDASAPARSARDAAISPCLRSRSGTVIMTPAPT